MHYTLIVIIARAAILGHGDDGIQSSAGSTLATRVETVYRPTRGTQKVSHRVLIALHQILNRFSVFNHWHTQAEVLLNLQ